MQYVDYIESALSNAMERVRLWGTQILLQRSYFPSYCAFLRFPRNFTIDRNKRVEMGHARRTVALTRKG